MLLRLNKLDLMRPEDSAEIISRIECACHCDWRYSEYLGYRDPAPHFHVVIKGLNADTSEHIACIE